MNQDRDRIKREWHADLPHSFGGKYRSYEYYKDLSNKKIDDEFKKNDIYTKFYQYRKAKHHNPIYVYRKREQFQADSVKFPDPLMLKATNNIGYLLVIIDVFTKYVWLFPLKQIKGVNVARCFQVLFNKNKPEKLTTDAGTEFLNQNVKRVLRDFNVKHFVAKGRTKAAVAERFNLTIQRLIYQLCRYYNTNDWTSDIILEKAKTIYLNRNHRTIKMTPTEAEDPANQLDLRKIYYAKYRKSDEIKKKAKFKINDTVRISALRGPFDRGYHQNFTTEVWTVSKVLDNLPLARYIVKDEQNEELDSILNENELIAYQPSDVFQIDGVLKNRTRKGRKEVFVSWLHYDDKFNSWIPAENLENIV